MPHWRVVLSIRTCYDALQQQALRQLLVARTSGTASSILQLRRLVVPLYLEVSLDVDICDAVSSDMDLGV
jgi:hypothetical protein